MAKLNGIFEQIESHTYTPDKCFLCGCILNEKNKTEEHVIPKWLQNEFNLWNQKIKLLNGTFLSYRFLTIPCCFECNNIHLEPFEKKVHEAYQGGYIAFQKLDKKTIFLWLGKIYFGIMYRELFLKLDRKDIQRGTITNAEYLKTFYGHFLFLQGIRGNHLFKDCFPASIHVFKTQKPTNKEKQFDFMDSHNTLFISIRMGEIGIISPLQDFGVTKEMEDLLEHHRDIDLHPLQFREMTAKILYKSLLMNRTPKYVSIQNEKVETVLMPIMGLSSRPLFNDWDNNIYSKFLSEITGVPLSVCQPEKDKVWTWLMDSKGKSIFMDVNI